MPDDALRSALRGHEPKAGRLAEICRALGLEFYIGPPRAGRGGAESSDPPAPISQPAVPAAALPREVADLLDLPPEASAAEIVAAIEARSVGGFDATALEERIAAVVRAETEGLRREATAAQDAQTETLAATLRAELADATALAHAGPGGDTRPSKARPVDVIELAVAAGGGAEALTEEIVGRLWFRRDWLDGHGLDASSCAVIGVRGESMEPTLMDGAKILVDRAHTRLLPGSIYVIRASEGLVVKRLEADAAGALRMVSDHPAWDDLPLPDDAEIVGRVVWTARTLVE